MTGPPDTTRPQVSTRDRDELRRRLVSWLATRVKEPEVSELVVPETNGMSSETVLFEASWSTEASTRSQRCAARLRPDAAAAPVFPVYDLERQCRAMQLVARCSDVPVPEVLFFEPDESFIGSPFIVMSQVSGVVPPDVMPYPFGSWLSEASPLDQRRLQDSTVLRLAELHAIDGAGGELGFLELDRPGESALARHLADTAAYYEWVVSDGLRSPLIERALSWLVANWPKNAADSVLSWGDARIGNVMYRDFEPVAVLDWEMVAVGPREVDLGWMIYLHRFLDDLALQFGLPGMPGFMARTDVAATYASKTGHEPRDLDWYTTYAAVRHAAVMSRVARRQVLFGEREMPADPDDMIMHRSTLEEMLAGTYWERF